MATRSTIAIYILLILTLTAVATHHFFSNTFAAPTPYPLGDASVLPERTPNTLQLAYAVGAFIAFPLTLFFCVALRQSRAFHRQTQREHLSNL